MRNTKARTSKQGGGRTPKAEGPRRLAEMKARLVATAVAGGAAILLLWASRGGAEEADPSTRASGGRAAAHLHEIHAGYVLVATSWDPDEILEAPYDLQYLDPDELRILNEARERWQNLDVAIRNR